MKMASIIVAGVVLGAGAAAAHGQVSGNVGYAGGGGRAAAEQEERGKRALGERDVPPTGDSMFIEASVLANVPADGYVAVFGVAAEEKTPEECARAMDRVVAEFTAAAGDLGVAGDDIDVDFIAQTRVYGFEIEGEVAREVLDGFELKKNVAIRYRDKALLDKLVAAAARSEIYDLIKVDYFVDDPDAVRGRLMDEAARVLKLKAGRFGDLLGAEVRPVQVLAERTSVYQPSRLYDAYVAAESEAVGAAVDRQRFVVRGARKSRTFYFNPLDGDGFDAVLAPVVVEPALQFTLYLKVRYRIGPDADEGR